MAEKDSERLVNSVAEVGKLRHLPRGLMYESVRIVQIPSVRIGRKISVSRIALDR